MLITSSMTSHCDILKVMHMQRIGLGIAGIFVSLFLLFSGITISASRASLVTFGPPVAYASSDLLGAIIIAAVIVAVAVAAPELFAGFDATFSGVSTFITEDGLLTYGALGGALEVGTVAAAVAINQVAMIVAECVTGLICGDDGGNPNSTYSVAANAASGDECYGAVNSCGQAYKGTYETDPATGAMGCKIGSSFAYGAPPESGCSGPAVTLTALGHAVNSGGSTTLNWDSPGAEYCVWKGGQQDVKVPPSGSLETGPLTQNTSYQIHCADSSGSYGQLATLTITVFTPQLTISANPVRVRAGGNSTITWEGKDVKSCTVTSSTGQAIVSGDADENRLFVASSPFLTTISTQNKFTIACQSLVEGDSIPPKSVLVNVVPEYEEF